MDGLTAVDFEKVTPRFHLSDGFDVVFMPMKIPQLHHDRHTTVNAIDPLARDAH